MQQANDSAVETYCLPPRDDIEAASFVVPADACDTHAHVISADAGFPLSPERSYTPPPAPEERYLRMLAMTGMTRGVLVQISVYGTDNRYMLEVLRRHPDRLRGVAVVAPNVTERELRDMHEAGVRGIRLNVLFRGGTGLDAMETLAHRIKDMGWHMQFLIDGNILPEMMPRLTRLPCPAVLDHMGHMPVGRGLDTPGFLALHALLAHHGFWIKLSGAMRISDAAPDYADVVPLAQSLIAAAPDRTVWGSDWPHVKLQTMPDTGHLRNALPIWAPDAGQLQRILVDNPARLYGFR